MRRLRRERKALVKSLARFGCKRGTCRCTKLTTSGAHSWDKVTGPSPKRSLRKRRMNGTWLAMVALARPRACFRCCA